MDKKCNCGCEDTTGHGCDCNENEDDAYYITLTLDDDSEVECMVVGFFDAADKEYVALLPDENNDQFEEGEVLLYRYSETTDENGDDQPILDVIEDDAEYEIVSDAFDKFLDTIELDEIVEDEE